MKAPGKHRGLFPPNKERISGYCFFFLVAFFFFFAAAFFFFAMKITSLSFEVRHGNPVGDARAP